MLNRVLRIINPRKLFLSLNTPTDTNKKKFKYFSANQHTLNKINFPYNAIPEKFLCELSLEIMDDPELIDGKHFNKQSTLNWEVNKDGEVINPLTTVAIKSKKSDSNRKEEIGNFVKQMIAITEIVKEAENIFIQFTSENQNRSFFSEINYPKELIPTEFADPLTGSISDALIVLDDIHVLDFFSLQRWWKQNPQYYFKNPFTHNYIDKIEFDRNMNNRLNKYVSQIKESCVTPSEGILTQFYLIEKYLQERDQKKSLPNHERLAKLPYTDKVPQNLIEHNFNSSILTDPVILDGKDIVDYSQLKSWWESDPNNLHKNFYTGLPIKTIEYDFKRKKEADEFCKWQENKTKMAIIPYPSSPFNLFKCQLQRKNSGLLALLENASSVTPRQQRLNK